MGSHFFSFTLSTHTVLTFIAIHRATFTSVFTVDFGLPVGTTLVDRRCPGTASGHSKTYLINLPYLMNPLSVLAPVFTLSTHFLSAVPYEPTLLLSSVAPRMTYPHSGLVSIVVLAPGVDHVFA